MRNFSLVKNEFLRRNIMMNYHYMRIIFKCINVLYIYLKEHIDIYSVRKKNKTPFLNSVNIIAQKKIKRTKNLKLKLEDFCLSNEICNYYLLLCF